MFHFQVSGLFVWFSLIAAMLTQSAVAQKGSASGSKRSQFLISATDLDAIKNTSNLRILDVREQRLYDAGHIAGATWVDIGLWRTKGAEQFGLKDAVYWANELGRLGIDPQQNIVVTGETLTDTARCWWVLRYLGMPNVRLLDGGLGAWSAASFKTTAEVPRIEKTMPRIEFKPAMLAVLSDVLPDARKATQCQVLDNRSTEEFNGSRQLGPRGGHIPGAKHLEWKEFVDDSGRFLSDAELKKRFIAQQIDLDAPVIAHCQTGGRSSVVALVAEMLGGKQVRNYVQGWSEYSGQLQAPIE